MVCLSSTKPRSTQRSVEPYENNPSLDCPAHVMRPSDGPDQVVVGTEAAVCSELEGGPGEEWSLGENDLCFAVRGVF